MEEFDYSSVLLNQFCIFSFINLSLYREVQCSKQLPYQPVVLHSVHIDRASCLSKHMIKGKMEYRYGEDLYLMGPGDSLTFSSEVEHGPERLLSKRIQFLAVLIHGEDDS